MLYYLRTFGCQQNWADSERIASYYQSRGMAPAETVESADVVVINTCVIRERAEEKIYGYIRNVREKNSRVRFVITGCLVGAASREPTGKMMKKLRMRLPDAEFLPLEEVGFEYPAKRDSSNHAWIPISSGCNNYCAYCIVPFSRGKERSRGFGEILEEAREAVRNGWSEITLLGQNVNSYGSDLVASAMGSERCDAVEISQGVKVTPVMVKHLNRYRIPTLFPHLLEQVARLEGVSRVSFLSSNPWDFSGELIDVIARNPNIDRLIHLPVQSGSDAVLKNMNRWYTRAEYMDLVARIRAAVPDVRFTTDIIVGFPGETLSQFEESLDLARQVGFEKGYVAYYSPRPGTTAMRKMNDDIPLDEKKRRFSELDAIVNSKSAHVATRVANASSSERKLAN